MNQPGSYQATNPHFPLVMTDVLDDAIVVELVLQVLRPLLLLLLSSQLHCKRSSMRAITTAATFYMMTDAPRVAPMMLSRPRALKAATSGGGRGHLGLTSPDLVRTIIIITSIIKAATIQYSMRLVPIIIFWCYYGSKAI